jgi:hypothetical protein
VPETQADPSRVLQQVSFGFRISDFGFRISLHLISSAKKQRSNRKKLPFARIAAFWAHRRRPPVVGIAGFQGKECLFHSKSFGGRSVAKHGTGSCRLINRASCAIGAGPKNDHPH